MINKILLLTLNSETKKKCMLNIDLKSNKIYNFKSYIKGGILENGNFMKFVMIYKLLFENYKRSSL